MREVLAFLGLFQPGLQADLHGSSRHVADEREVVARGPPDGEVRDLDRARRAEHTVGPGRRGEDGVERGASEGLVDVVDEHARIAAEKDRGDPLADLVLVLGLAEGGDVLTEGEARGRLHEASLARTGGRGVDGEERTGPIDRRARDASEHRRKPR